MDEPLKKLWREGNRFIKKIVRREAQGEGEWVTLECGHRWFLPMAEPKATAHRCRFCVREEFTGWNPAHDPTPVKVTVP